MTEAMKTAFSKLDDLLSAGILSQADYQTRKDELIEKYMGGGDLSAPTFPTPPATTTLVTTVVPTVGKIMCATHNRLRSASCMEQVCLHCCQTT